MAAEAIEVATRELSQLGMIDCPIAKFADEDLAAIFKYLPPYERLIVSEVCRKWRDINQTPWRDVTHLELSQVPTQNIHAVIKKCPNPISVSGLRQNLGDLGRFASRLSNIASLKCVDCTFTVDQSVTRSIDLNASFRSAAWNELIWHNSKTVVMNSFVSMREYSLPFEKPRALRRFQMSELSRRNVAFSYVYDALQLPLLECLIMTDLNWQRRGLSDEEMAFALLATSPKLRELYLDGPGLRAFVKLAFEMPHLQIVFLHNIDFEQQPLERLMTMHRSLRVLVITASRTNQFNGEITVPVRKLFPNSFNAPAVPLLHLFLGKFAAESLRFHPSPTNALKIYPINAPLPEFLEKEEIKPIFEGSWIASRIIDGAKEGVNLADFSAEGNAESISYVF